MTTITPQYVNMPKPGKSYGSIKLANGNKFVGRAEVLGMMQKGLTYEVETETQRWGDGDVAVITKATLANGHAAASQQTPHTDDPDRYKKQPTPKVDAERMFVAGALNSLLPAMYTTHQGLTPRQVEDAVLMLRQVWLNTFGSDE